MYLYLCCSSFQGNYNSLLLPKLIQTIIFTEVSKGGMKSVSQTPLKSSIKIKFVSNEFMSYVCGVSSVVLTAEEGTTISV
jgi:hypothetical protein